MTGFLHLHPSTLFFFNSLWFTRVLKTCLRLFAPLKSLASTLPQTAVVPSTTHQTLGPSAGRKLSWWDMDVLEQKRNGMSIRSKDKSLGWKWSSPLPWKPYHWGRKLYHWFNSPWTQSSSQLFFFSKTFFSLLPRFQKAKPSISVK